MKTLCEGVVSEEGMCKAIELNGGFTMGPLELPDLVGLDTALRGTKSIYQQLGQEKFRPPQCLIKNLQAGYFARKAGKRFTTTNDEDSFEHSYIKERQHGGNKIY